MARPEEIPLAQQIRAVEREIALRERVYPNWVAAGRMTSETAEHEVAAMKAAARTLKRLAGGDQQNLF